MLTPPSNRIVPIDVLRALTMLLMIFVNDLWSLKDIPLWLEHTAAETDGMGLADVVFPSFLFIVGMSVPLSIAQRRLKGDDNLHLARHILERSVALLVMGVFLVNGETINEAASGMTRAAWFMISCTCFIAVWNSWPGSMNRWLKRTIRGVGIVALFILAWLYRGGSPENPESFAPQWWGILGLIGWAYLVTALVYLFSGKAWWIRVLAWMIFLGTCMASHAKVIPGNDLFRQIISPLGDGAMPALTMGGALVTDLVLYFRKQSKISSMYLALAVLALVAFGAGVYLRPFWGISKIRATPSWVLICSALTVAVFILVYWLCYQKRKAHWFAIIEPAGTNTLTCYLLPYYAYGLMMIFSITLPAVITTGAVGLLKSLLFSLLIILLAGWLGKRGLRVKL